MSTTGSRSKESEDGPAAPISSVALSARQRLKAASASPAIASLTQRFGLLIVLVLLFGLFSVLLPSSFPTTSNISNMVSTQTVVLILLVGLMLPLSAGDFDLSVAVSMVLSSIVTLLAVNDWHLPGAVAALCGILSAGVVGVINSILIVGVGMNAFIVTLAMMTVVDAINNGLTNSAAEVMNHSWLNGALNTQLGIFPLSVYYAWALAAVAWYILEFTPLGRYLRATGIARNSARLRGVPTIKLRWFAFLGASLMAGVAGVILVETVGSVDASTSSQYLLYPYAAAFLGTAAIKLGWFNMIGGLIAIYLVVVGSTGLELLGYSSWVGELFQGVALIFGLLLSRILSRSRQVVVGHFE